MTRVIPFVDKSVDTSFHLQRYALFIVIREGQLLYYREYNGALLHIIDIVVLKLYNEVKEKSL